MADIKVRTSGDEWRVTVTDGTTTTEHDVTVPTDLAALLGVDVDDPDAVAHLVRTSFEFLLEREPSSAILRSFSLEVIGRYFPEYASEIGDRLGPGPD